VLGSRGLSSPDAREGRYSFVSTGEDPDAFRALGTRFLQLPLGEVERVRLEPSHDLAGSRP
jgi:glutamate racemase